MLYRTLIRPLLFSIDPERAHHLALRVLPWLKPILGWRFVCRTPALERTLWGLQFRNPLGLAAGFDKEARVVGALERLGFGFLEIGAVSSQARPGNPRPRIFRLREDRGLINRMGLPNAGAAATAARLARNPKPGVPLFANIVKTADLEGTIDEMADDYLVTLEALFPYVDGFTVNVSCPASPELREFGRGDAMFRLLGGLVERRDALRAGAGTEAVKPLILKVSPDIDAGEFDVIIESCRRGLVDGLVLTNTTMQRPDSLKADAKVTAERGGLSGAPLFPIALAQVRRFAEALQGSVPIIGVGGIASASEARQMLDAGASLIEIYTGFVYQGPGVVRSILAGLDG